MRGGSSGYAQAFKAGWHQPRRAENTLCLSEGRSPFAFAECGYEQTTYGAHRIGSGMISVFFCAKFVILY
jgi:hypothetical protein